MDDDGPVTGGSIDTGSGADGGGWDDGFDDTASSDDAGSGSEGDTAAAEGDTTGADDSGGTSPFDPLDVVVAEVEIGAPSRGMTGEGRTVWRIEPEVSGPTVPGSAAWVTSSLHQAHVDPSLVGAGPSALELELRDTLGGVVDGVNVAVELAAFSTSSALPASELWSASTSVQVKDGRLRVELSALDTASLAVVEPAWLRVELEGQVMAPLLRWGEVPFAIVAEAVPSAGVEADTVVPQDALEASSRVATWTVRAGEMLTSLPDPQEWDCAWRARDAAALRVQRRDVLLTCCDADDPIGLCGSGSTHPAQVETWVSAGVGVHATGATDCNLASPECAPRVWARVVPWSETPTLDDDCSFVGKPWQVGAPHVITTPDDPHAGELLLTVDAVCTRR